MHKYIFVTGFLLSSFFASAQSKIIDRKVNSLLKEMTLQEKIGQLNQYSGENWVTGPIVIKPNFQSDIQ